MKKFLQIILSKLGLRVVKQAYYKNLVNINILDSLDFYNSVKKNLNSNDALICFDIGANVGQTAKKLVNYFPNVLVYSFEPMRKTFANLTENLSGIKNIQLFNIAFGSKAGQVEVVYQENSE